MKRGLALILTLFLLASPAHALYADVPEDAWYLPATTYAQLKGFMNGVGDNCFDPQGTMTRGMLAAVLHRMAGSPSSTAGLDFRDVLATPWCADAVVWCAEQGIVTGIDPTHFAPNDPVTREQVALMLWRLAGWPQVDSTALFWDSYKINIWSQLGVDWACRMGIVTGKPDGSFDPQGYATRAEVAQMLLRFDRWRSAQAG